MIRFPAVATLFVCALLLIVACDDEPPRRKHIDVLRNKLRQLEKAVVAKDRAAIDSLLSIQILDEGQSSDSLLSFVYGPGGDFPLAGFSLIEMFYTGDKARIDVEIVDSTGQVRRPTTFTLVHEHDRWLFKKFEPGRFQDRGLEP